MNESTPLLASANGAGPSDANTTNYNGSHTGIDHQENNLNDSFHSLPDIPEGEAQTIVETPSRYRNIFRFTGDDANNLNTDEKLKREGINNDGTFEEDETHENNRSDHRRTLSFDLVIEDAVEMFHHVTDIVSETVVEVKEEIAEIFEEEVLPVKPREDGEHSKKLSTIALAVLVFYKVSGGPFGCEPAVKAAGPFVALLGFTLFPLVWSLQEALITAELGSAYPEPSGSVAWIEEAFGPKAGLVCGYFHWVSGATDNAIYPSLFLQYLTQYITNGDDSNSFLSSSPVRFLFTILIATVLALINYSGLEIVGHLSIAVCIISMSPFVILCILGIPQVDPQRWFVMPDTNMTHTYFDTSHVDEDVSSFLPSVTFAGVLWRPFVNSLFWNLNSFDVGASFAGEVKDPDRVFPKAMFLSVILVVFSYLLPLLIAIGAVDSKQSQWDAGYFTDVSNKIAGPWLAGWTVFAAAVSNIALFEAEMSGDAYQLMGMADRGLIPKVFCKRSRFGTPTNGILVGTLVIFSLGVADFDALVEMLNFAYSIALLMEFAAFIKLRITDSDVIRPYRVPLNTFGCVLFILPPSLICIYVMVVATNVTYMYFVALMTFGCFFHFIQKLAKHYHWWSYVEALPLKSKRTGSNTPLTSTPTNCSPKLERTHFPAN